jgi:membrane associated rhomboid family serine protease
MVEVAASAAPGGVELDVCDRCHFVWFDQGEIDSLPVVEREPEKVEELDPRVREQLAIAEVGLMRQRAETDNDFGEAPGEWWQVVCSVLGMPVEENATSVKSWPMVTWMIGLTMVLVTVFGMISGDLETWIAELGLLPGDLWRHGGITFLTSLVLHAGLIHLLGNLYFLLVFGDNCEEALGWRKFGLLFLLSGAVGDLCHLAFDGRAEVPLVGASGAIAGLLAFYAMRFPHVRIVYFLRFYVLFRFIRMNVRWALVIWVGLQLFGAWQQIAGFSNVSALAHLGGAAVGFGFFWLDRWWTERGTPSTSLETGKGGTDRRPGGYNRDYR